MFTAGAEELATEELETGATEDEDATLELDSTLLLEIITTGAEEELTTLLEEIGAAELETATSLLEETITSELEVTTGAELDDTATELSLAASLELDLSQSQVLSLAIQPASAKDKTPKIGSVVIFI